MRIHLFGGVLAFDYMLAGWLRERGVDARYFFNLKRSEGDYPWWEDATFDRDSMPSWCRYFPFRLPYLYPGALSRAGRDFVKEFDRGADLLLVIGEGVFLAPRFTTPYAVWSCGFDVAAAMPLPIRWRGLVARARDRSEPVRLQRRLNRRYVAKALHGAESVISVMEFQVPTFLTALGLTDSVKQLPMLYDCTRYVRSPDAALIRRYAAEEVVFFLPTRHTYGFGDISDKGADKAIRAFAAFAKDPAAPRSRLIMVEKGEQIANSKAAVQRLGIGHLVDWLPHLSKDDVRKYYSLPNVVVLDQFQNEDSMDPTLHRAVRRLGARGSIFAESMCVGVPVISTVGSEWLRRISPRPFVWDACSEAEITEAMAAVARIPVSERAHLAASNRKWAFRNLHWESLIDTYIDHFQALIEARTEPDSRVPLGSTST